MNATSTARALRVLEKSPSATDLRLCIEPMPQPAAGAGEAVIEVLATAVNTSDVKAALGAMPQVVWPRTPGRDFAGRVVDGPTAWHGVDVWGTGGDLGITRDGSHARYLVLPLAALARKPARVPLVSAGTVGVPFVTAYEGLRRAGLRGSGQTVAVFGAGGKVGQAAVQLARRAGAQVVAVLRGAAGNAAAQGQPEVRWLDAAEPELAERVREATGGRGADIAYNNVGSPYFQSALDSLATGGTQILISTLERSVPFDILPFYRRNLQLLGVDSLKLDAPACAAILDLLAPGFEDGTLHAFPVDASTLVPLDGAMAAYQRVFAGSSDRVVLAP